MDQLTAESDNENQLNQVIDQKAEKPVQIFADKPGRIE
jgi:hypothetical protein